MVGAVDFEEKEERCFICLYTISQRPAFFFLGHEAIYHWYAAKQEPGILHGCWCASSGTNLDNFGEGPPVVSSVFRERGGGAQGELKREKYDLAMEDAYTQQTLFPKRFYKKKFYIHM